MQPADQQTKLAMSFLCDLDPAQDPYESFCVHLLSNLLLEGPNAPFYKSVIESGLAPNFCPGVGFDYTTRQPTFTLGVQGIKNETLPEAEKVIMQTLKEVVEQGIDKAHFEQTLHEIEINAKKTRQNTGLMFIANMVSQSIHGGDPLSVFKIHDFSQRIREDFDKGGLFERLVDKHLKSNPHYLRLYYTADEKKQAKEDAAEAKQM
jgi:Zn-dependent M16 (insulinase) family peptidase